MTERKKTAVVLPSFFSDILVCKRESAFEKGGRSMADFTSRVTFPQGSCREKTAVTAIVRRGDELVVMTDTTPFHHHGRDAGRRNADRKNQRAVRTAARRVAIFSFSRS
jgi:hypothetical protein